MTCAEYRDDLSNPAKGLNGEIYDAMSCSDRKGDDIAFDLTVKGVMYLQPNQNNLCKELGFAMVQYAATQLDSPFATMTYANLLRQRGLELDSIKWYRKAAEKGVPLGAYEYAIILYEGRGGSSNKDEAIKWMKIAAEKNISEAAYFLGEYYQRQGLDNIANDYYRQAAKKGFALARNKLSALNRVKNNIEEGAKNVLTYIIAYIIYIVIYVLLPGVVIYWIAKAISH